jgi:hypothetical protein
MDATEWSVYLADISRHIMAHGKIPYKLPTASRHMQNGCMAVVCIPCCIPCCAWSTFWRIIACPIMCCLRGPGFMCSNNICTKITDGCIAAPFEAVNAEKILDRFPRIETASDKAIVIGALTDLKALFDNAEVDLEMRMKQGLLIDACMRVVKKVGGTSWLASSNSVTPSNCARFITEAIERIQLNDMAQRVR